MSHVRSGKKAGVGTLVLVALVVPAIAQTPSFTTSGQDPGDFTTRPNPHPLAPQQITQSTDPNTLVAGTSVACSGGGITTDNHWWRLFDLDDDHHLTDAFTIDSIDYGIEVAVGPTQNITATTHCLDEGLPFLLAFLDLADTNTIPQPDADLEFFNIAVGGSCDTATEDLAVDMSSDDCLSGDASACNCCSAGDGVGCDCDPCEDEICSMDPFCCAIFWDDICDGEAQANCTCCAGQDPGTCSGGGGGSGCNCCSGGDGVGCDDATCAGAVCALDWFCCEVAWDPLCNAIAEDQCSCCPPAGTNACNCCTDGDGVGCDCAPCENEICTLDPFCCAVYWDTVCNEEAQANCSCCTGQDPGSCGGGGPSGCNCCSGGDGIGCDDTTCSDAVCAEDWFCCEVAWDSLCNARAESQCSCCAAPSPPLGTGCLQLFIGCNDLGQSAPTYVHADDCGIFDPVDLASLGFPNAQVVYVVNGAAGGGSGDGSAGDGSGDGGAGDGGGVPAADGLGVLVTAALLLAASAYFLRRWFSGSAR